MFMHVKAKTMAFSGLLLALTVIFMVLGSVIETSTLFLLAERSCMEMDRAACAGRKEQDGVSSF